MKKIIIFAITTALTVFIIMFSGDVKESVENAILISGRSIIPSLFPLCCICLIIVNSGLLCTLHRRVILPFTFMVSMVAGYPIGAKMLNSMVNKKIITEKDAKKILPCMICSGPAFAISVVGQQIFNNKDLGLRIYLVLIISNFILFLLLGGMKIKCNTIDVKISIIDSFIKSVKSAAESIVLICAYVIFFTAVCTTIRNLTGETAGKIFLYIFEVTGGIYSSKNFYLTCAILAFGGICVLCQIITVTPLIKVSLPKISAMRLFSAVLSCCLLKLSFLAFPMGIQTISTTTSVIPTNANKSIYVSIVFLFSLIVFLSSLSTRVLHKVYR